MAVQSTESTALVYYMQSPGWSEQVIENVRGHDTPVWRERPRHVVDLFDLTTQGNGKLDFLVQGERRIRHAMFRSTVDHVASKLMELGVARGERVLIVLYNSPEFWLVQWATWRMGAIPVLGNRWWSESDLADALQCIAPALVVTDLPCGAEEIGCPVLSPTTIAGCWTDEPAADPIPDPRTGSSEDDIAVIVFTAGSTGSPKGVQLSHRALVWTQQTTHVLRGSGPARPNSPEEQKVTLKTTPLFHNGGMVAAIGTMIDGGRIVMLDAKFDAESVIQLIEREKVSSWSAVPTMIRRVIDHPHLADYDLSSLTALASGGALVRAELVEAVGRALPNAGIGFTSGYGMTEMSFLTIVPGRTLIERGGTVGKAIPGVRLRIADPDETGEGELVARSAALMSGYFRSIEDPVDADGWYHTGDLGRIDEDGFVYITGRCKDMVIRGGENIACAHVEAALAMHPEILDVAVVGIPDEEFGEALAAFIQQRPGASLTFDDIREHAKVRLAYFEIPSVWKISEQPLPVLATGKVDKPGLRARFS